MKKAGGLFLLLPLLFIFTGCPNSLFQLDHNQDIPPGMGTLYINVDAARSIAPEKPDLSEFTNFEFTFLDNSDDTINKFYRTESELGAPFILPHGSYHLTVTALKDGAAGLVGSVPVDITAGAVSAIDVPLLPIVNRGEGLFTWDITLPDDVTASMHITPLSSSGTPEHEAVFADGSSTLNSGYYRILITLTKGEITIYHRETLHIYAGMTSGFEKEFLDSDFIERLSPVVVTSGGTDTPYSSLAQALASIDGSGTYTVTVNYDQTLSSNWTVPTGADVTITSGDTKNTITRGTQDTNASSGLFIVGGTGAQLTLENIIIDGDKDNSAFSGNAASLVRVNVGGVFTMNAGAVLRNNRAANGGSVYVNGSTSSSGSFTMNGGEISGNIATTNGGGVYVNYAGGSTAGLFTMTGGEIKNNTATAGGGVYSSGIFTMTSGEISGNRATNGGGVFLSSGSSNITFTVGGNAKIRGNTLTDNLTASNAYISGGYITLGTGVGAPAPGMEIRVQTAAASGLTVQSGANAGNAVYFHADEAGRGIHLLGDMMFIREQPFAQGQTDFYTQVAGYADATADMTITVNGNLSLPLPVQVPVNSAGHTLTIRGSVPAITIKPEAINLGIPSGLFIVPSGAKLVFEDIIIDGDKDNLSGNRAPLVYITGGVFTMNDNAVLQNNSAVAMGGGGVYNGGGTFIMNGGRISGNTSNGSGGGVNNTDNGIFTMSGGEIRENNTSNNSGGGVYVSSGTFTMSGGEITGNAASSGSSGGGVYSVGGTFNMEGGTISENTGNGGGGVYFYNGGTFNMSGGTISGNTATSTTSGGGGVLVSSGCTFNMSGGTISGNTADSRNNSTSGGGGVFVSGGTFNMSGGEIKENTNQARGGGVYYGSGTFKLGGTAKIRGNTLADNTTVSNAYLASGLFITLGDGTGDPTVPEPDDGMEIRVQTATANGVIVDTGATSGVVRYFHADETGKRVVLSGTQLVIADATAQTFNITIPEFDTNEILSSGITLSRTNSSGNSSTGELQVTNSYPVGTEIVWLYGIDDTVLVDDDGDDAILSLDVSDLVNLQPYNILGYQDIYVEARLPGVGGAVYGVTVRITVVE